MAPSERTEQRRLQRAAQRQRLREGQAANTAEEAAKLGIDGTNCIPASATASLLKKLDAHDGLTAEAFAAAICQLVDLYRGSQSMTSQQLASHIAPMPEAQRGDARPTLLGQRCSVNDAQKAVPKDSEAIPATDDETEAPLMLMDQMPPSSPAASSSAASPSNSTLPSSPTACPYVVRNTFIDLAETPRGDAKASEVVFSTWPGAKLVSTDDVHCHDTPLESISSPTKSLWKDKSNDESKDSEENCAASDANRQNKVLEDLNKAADTALTGEWQPMQSTDAGISRSCNRASRISAQCDMASVDSDMPEDSLSGRMEVHNVGLGSVSRQSSDILCTSHRACDGWSFPTTPGNKVMERDIPTNAAEMAKMVQEGRPTQFFSMITPRW